MKKILYILASVLIFSCSVESPPDQIKKQYDLAIPVFSHKLNMSNYQSIFNSLAPVGVKEIPAGVEIDGSKVGDFENSYSFMVADFYEDEKYIETLTPKYYIKHNLPEGIKLYIDAYVVVNGAIDRFWFTDEWHELETSSKNNDGDKIAEYNAVTLKRKRMESIKEAQDIYFNVKMVTTSPVSVDELVKSRIDINVGMRAEVYMVIDL